MANKGHTKKNRWSEIVDSLAEDRRVRAELEAKKLEAHDAHEQAKVKAAVEKVRIKQEVKLEMEKAWLQAAHEESLPGRSVSFAMQGGTMVVRAVNNRPYEPYVWHCHTVPSAIPVDFWN